MTRARLWHEYVHTPERNEGWTEVMKIVSRPPWSRGMLQYTLFAWVDFNAYVKSVGFG